MSIYIEDTARNTLASWTIDAAAHRDSVRGAIMSPFTTPVRSSGYKQSATTTVARLRSAGLEVLLDPMTHVLQMPNMGDVRFYADWPFWGAAAPSWATVADREDHVRRVFAVQDNLDIPRLAPTLLLHTPQSSTSQQALDMATFAVAQGPCILTVAGDGAFWASDALDAHIGALAQLQPAGWHLVVARASTLMPAAASASEVFGVARTCFALSAEAVPIHVSHGDLAGLPAMAAGATSVGTGGDPRQRVLAYPNFEMRVATPGTSAGWFQRVTLAGLYALLKPNDLTLARVRDPALVTRLMPGVVNPPGPKEAFLHHVAVLHDWFGTLIQDPEIDVVALHNLYLQAEADWVTFASRTGLPDAANLWVLEARQGCEALISDEGW